MSNPELVAASVAVGRFLEAMVLAKKAVAHAPGDPGARLLVARVHLAAGRRERARQEVARILREFPDFADAREFQRSME